MKSKKSRKVFSKTDLYNFVLAQICADNVKKESGYESDIFTFIKDDMEEKYDKLSEAGQKEFNVQLKKAVKQFGDDIKNIDRNEDDYEYYINILTNNISLELDEFLCDS